MTQQEIIQRIYGEYYEVFQSVIDEWGRIKVEDFVMIRVHKDLLDSYVDKMVEDLRLEYVGDDKYFQPSSLMHIGPNEPESFSKEDVEFIDKIAAQTMNAWLSSQLPSSTKDCLMIARLSYRQALAMWQVKNFGLQQLIDEAGIKRIV